MMQNIYKCANRVVAWLSNEGSGTIVSTFFNDMCEIRPGSSKQLSSRTEKTWDEVMKFFHHPWFQRVWIIQEMVMASDIVVIYGTEEMEWNKIINTIEYLFNPILRAYNPLTLPENRRCLREFPSEILQVRQVHAIRKKKDIKFLDDSEPPQNPKIIRFDNVMMPGMSEIIRRCSSAQATEPKDKLYALLGISLEAIRTRNRPLLAMTPTPLSYGVFSPDYKVPTPVVYMKCALNLLVNENVPHRTPLNILPITGIGYERNFNLPSWAPDWSNPPQPWTLSYDRGDQWDYRASGITCDHWHFNTLPPGGADVPFSGGGDFLMGFPRRGLRQYTWLHTDPWQILLKGVQVDKWKFDLPEEGMEHSIVDILAFSEEHFHIAERYTQDPTVIPFLEDILDIQATPFPATMRKAVGHRKFAVTERGLMGLVPPGTREGDSIWILLGAQAPFILRQANSTKMQLSVSSKSDRTTDDRPWYEDWDGFVNALFKVPEAKTLIMKPDSIDGTGAKVWQNVGECYVHGMMDGEGLGDAVKGSEINKESKDLETIAIL
ncbi:hypothetical protein M501DRAFT_993110 [Patellaria atrata CBS 101060]|uniref:Heterokaryon incompatibility domain-containing protein n=1 Tax=Patellaria atrata CBS 101060 TaxID=1346257 RepID=A0A9P4S904_9PEZI|nr:hypothetical protein M501DRAFT_993110 [Patellaria atrata CBS 101060]